MKGTIKSIEQVTAASGSTYSKLYFNEEEYANRKIISFSKDKFEIGKEYEFTVKENPDTSLVITPKRNNAFSPRQTTDISLECLKMAVELFKCDKIKNEQVEQMAKRLKDVYSKL